MSIIRLVAVCFLLSAAAAVAQQQPFVYRIIAGQCTKSPSVRALTGFRIADLERKGIFTALHGVAGCSNITARAGVNESYAGLYIKSFDEGQDVALLSSSALENAEAKGLTPAASVLWDRLTNVLVFGYPYGTDEHGDQLRVRIPAVRALDQEITDDIFLRLKTRSSPSVNQRVLSLQGPLGPGDSGAPIMVNGLVVAIGNGGLLGGMAQFGWAIPYSDVKLSRADANQLASLAQLPVDGLFAFASGNEGLKAGPSTIEAALKRAINGRGAIVYDVAQNIPKTETLKFISYADCNLEFANEWDIRVTGHSGGTKILIPLSEISVNQHKCDCNIPDRFAIGLTVSDGISSIKSTDYEDGRDYDKGETGSYFFKSVGKNQADAIVAAFSDAILACKK